MNKQYERMIKLPEENDIIRNWKSSELMVSILCFTYNHEKFIDDAIRSFIIQKTDFPFDVVIHDDASTDKTPDIIRSYHDEYPNIIKPVLQKENQYQKGINIVKISVSHANGKFIALCEGDDYWTDNNKLQIQSDIMLSLPDTSLTFHAVDILDAAKNRIVDTKRIDTKSRYFSMEEIIKGGGGLIGTQSIMIRRDVFNNPPDFLYNSPATDYPLVLLAKTKGNAYYIDIKMAVYRTNNINSAMGKIKKLNFNDIVDRYIGSSIMLEKFNKYTNLKYKKYVNKKRSELVTKAFRRNCQGINYSVKINKFIKSYPHLILSDKLLLLIFLFFPTGYSKENLIKFIKNQKFTQRDTFIGNIIIVLYRILTLFTANKNSKFKFKKSKH